MKINHISIEQMDLKDEKFRISEDLDSEQLRRSLSEIGQLNPVVLLAGGDSLSIVCGFRRIRALLKCGETKALARVCLAEKNKPIQAYCLALWDNISHRELHPLEKARVLSQLKNPFALPETTIVETYLPVLGLAPNTNVLRCYLKLHTLQPKLRELLKNGRLTTASAERLAGSPWVFQERIAQVMERMHLSASLQRQILDLVDEVAALKDIGPEAVLYQPDIQCILGDPRLSSSQRGEFVRRFLHGQRNPRFFQAKTKFNEEKTKLGLPGTIRLSHDPFFETSRLHIEFEADSAEKFRELATALQAASQAPSLKQLFRVE